MSSDELIKLLQKNGWRFQNSKGSHWKFSKPGVRWIISIPHPRKDLRKGLLEDALKKAGLK